MAERLNHFKKDYRARFCYREGKQQINVQPGQNVLKIIHDCFENCVNDSPINSPSTTYCSTPVILNQKEEDLLLNKELHLGLFSSVKKTFNYTSSSTASPVKSISSSAGQAPEPCQKSKKLDEVVSSNKKEGHEFKEDKSSREDDLFYADDHLAPNKEVSSILKNVGRSSQRPAAVSDDEEYNCEIIGSPVLVEEAETSVNLLTLDEQIAPALMKKPMEVQRSNSSLARMEEQTVPMERTKSVTVPSEQKKKSLSSAFLMAVTTGTIEKRYSASIAPPPSPVKDLDLEMENECEFLIDESDGFSSTSWFSIPQKNKKLEKQAFAKPVPKSQPSKREKAVIQESKKRKAKKAQNEVTVKLTCMEQSRMKACNVAEEIQDKLQNTSDTNLGLSDRKEDALKSVRQSSPPVEGSEKCTHTEKSTRTPNEKKSMALKERGPRKYILPLCKSDTDTSDTEHKPKEIPNEDSFGSCSVTEQPDDQVASSIEDHVSKPSQFIVKTALCSSRKKQSVKQKLSKVTSSKKLAENRRNKVKKSTSRKSRVQISEESSESEPTEKEDERELLISNEMFAASLEQESQTSGLQKSLKSLKCKNIHSLKSSVNTYTKTPTKSKDPSQNCMDNIQETGQGKRASAKSPQKATTKIKQRTNMIVFPNPENAEPGSTTDHSNDSGLDTAERKHKSSVPVKTKYKKKSNVHLSHGSILKHVKFTSKNKPIECELENSSSDTSEVLVGDASDFLLKTPLKHKLVMPTHTPNVRRTKRIRLKPLEYWRGERVNYMTRPSGGFVVGGIVSPGKDPCRKARKKRKHTRETRSHLVEDVDVSLADASEPTAVWDPTVNEEVLLECVNIGSNHSCFFNDESVEIFKNLNTSCFAAGKLILKPLKEKGYQFVPTDKIAFHVIRGKIIVTLHKTSYCLTTGDFFYVPAGNGYNIHNLLNEESILLFTQLKGERPIVEDSLNELPSP